MPVLVLATGPYFRSKAHPSLDCLDTLGVGRFGICRLDGVYSVVDNSILCPNIAIHPQLPQNPCDLGSQGNISRFWNEITLMQLIVRVEGIQVVIFDLVAE